LRVPTMIIVWGALFVNPGTSTAFHPFFNIFLALIKKRSIIFKDGREAAHMSDFFHRKLQQLIVRGETFPVGGALFVYLGPDELEEFDRIRQSADPCCPFLYLYPGTVYSAVLQTRLEKDDMAMALPLEAPESTSCFALIINCLHLERISLARTARDGVFSDGAVGLVAEKFRELIAGYNQFRVSELLHLRCGLRNLPAIIRNHGLQVKGSGPCLICGAGPSLETQLDWLRRNREKFYLIAVGKLGPRLKQAGIMPDCLVYADNSGYGLDWQDFFRPETLLVTYSCAAPEVCRYASTIYFAQGPDPFFNRALSEWRLVLPQLAYGGTATLTAIDFARRVGFSPVALTGNDLCLDGNGMSHLPQYSDEAQFEHHLVKIEGNDGTVVSTPEFIKLKDCLEQYLCGLEKPGIYNCTAGGACIAGSLRMPLEHFPPDDCGIPEITGKCDAVPGSQLHWSGYLDQAVEELAAMTFNIMPLPSVMPDGYAEYRRAAMALLQQAFAGDLRQDFENAVNREKIPPTLAFSGFRQLALAVIRRGNPELADYLNVNRPPADGFNVEYYFTEYAYISRRTDHGIVALTDDYLHMAEKAEKTIAAFLAGQDFSPERHAVVFVAPVSWMHVVAFGRSCPQGAALILEPWPELLSELIDNCLFMPRIPYDSTVIAAASGFPDWRRQYQRRVRELKRKGMELLFFINPATAEQPEVLDIIRQINP